MIVLLFSTVIVSSVDIIFSFWLSGLTLTATNILYEPF